MLDKEVAKYMYPPPTQFTATINNLPTYSPVYTRNVNFLLFSLLSPLVHILKRRETFFLYFDNGVELTDESNGKPSKCCSTVKWTEYEWTSCWTQPTL